MSAVTPLQKEILDTGCLPVHELAPFLEDPESVEAKNVCKKMAETIHECGCLVIKDPRVPMSDNEVFIDMIEKYFEQPKEEKEDDIHPELFYQVGATPNGIETPRCTTDPFCHELIEKQSEEDKAHLPTGSDPKWRFFWRIGDRPEDTKYKELNAEPVIPKKFSGEWESTMNGWGSKLLMAVSTTAEMLALGLGLEQDSFTHLMKNAPHLLAPTGTPLENFTEEGDIFAGFHYDLSFLTIHGKSRYPGLFVWLTSGKKLLVRIPDGCLLVQAGKQMEILTAGHVSAGYHEVVMAKETLLAKERAIEEKRSLWRVSSTLFGHIASDNILCPLGKFAKSERAVDYPPISAGDQVQAEINLIKLKGREEEEEK